MAAADAEIPLEDHDLELLATAAYLTGDDAGAEAAWTRAYAGWLRVGQKRRAARCAFWLILELLAVGDWARGSGWLSTAERALEDDPDCPERALLLVLAARRHAKQGDAAAAEHAVRRAASLARDSDDPELKAFGLLGLAQAEASRGKRDAAMALFDEVMVTVITGGVSPMSAGVVYCAVIEACYEILDVGRAREWTAALTRWCERQPDLVPFRGHCLVHRAEILRLTGGWSDAMAEATRVCALASTEPGASPAPDHRRRAYPVGAAFYEVAEIHRMRGEFADAERSYRLAHEHGRLPEPGLALLRLAQGRVDLAAAAIRRVHAQRQKRVVRAAVLAACVEILLAAGDLRSARAAVEELAHLTAIVGGPYLRALLAQGAGTLLLAEEQPHAALAACRSSWADWQELDVPYEAARVRVVMALSCRRLGDAEGADLELEAARRVFARLEAAPELARADRLRSAPVEPFGRLLTARELQVLRSIAAGKTNRTIARDLSISERTVDRHVSNILTKLDLPSRSAATAYAYEHGLIR